MAVSASVGGVEASMPAPEASGDFDDIFAMMMDRFPEPQAKRPRIGPSADPAVLGEVPGLIPAGQLGATVIPLGSEGEAVAPSAPAAAATGDPGPAATGKAIVAVPGSARGPPPGHVIAAYALLNLPLTSSPSEVVRQSRRLARQAHPDKVSPDFPERRRRAELEFQQLQEAKRVVLSWLSGCAEVDFAQGWSSGEDADAPGSDEEGDEAVEELRACGVADEVDDDWDERPDELEDGGDRRGEGDDRDGPDGADENDDVDLLGVGASEPRLVSGVGNTLLTAGASEEAICTGDHALAQATALSAFLAAPRGKRKRLCQECFHREALPDEAACKRCKDELAKVMRTLRGRPDPDADSD
mmetsp:Transcript_13366/g.38351  ORF Transcript_13366/g.38351 Transcript_13366/m.38351 type:complete len:357 (+) Transcript_13366:84-1154(+)